MEKFKRIAQLVQESEKKDGGVGPVEQKSSKQQKGRGNVQIEHVTIVCGCAHMQQSKKPQSFFKKLLVALGIRPGSNP